MCKRTALTFIVLSILCAVQLPAKADWYIVADPVTGAPQAIWSTNTPGYLDEEISYSRLSGTTWGQPIAFTASAYADASLVVASTTAGEVKIAWGTHEAIDRVFMRSLAPSIGVWGPEILVSDPAEPSGHPSIVVYNGATYVALESTQPSGSRSAKVTKVDSAGTVERSLVGDTSSHSALGIRLHSESGHLWMEWLESTASLGYSAMVNGVWQAPQHEPCTGPSDIDPARARIRSHVLGS